MISDPSFIKATGLFIPHSSNTDFNTDGKASSFGIS
jgi:hypothetical protein